MKQRRRHLGTWMFLCDIAGQVSNTPNRLVTSVTVAIPVEMVSTVRARLLRRFGNAPQKWKTGGRLGFQYVAEVVEQFRLPTAIAQVHSENPTAWQRYAAQGENVLAIAERRLGRRPGFMGPDTVLRMLMFERSFAWLIGCLLRTRGLVLDRPGAMRSTMRLEIVADSDLREQEARVWFSKAVASWSEGSLAGERLGVEFQASARCETEQAEPLLLLPDYIAGVHHHGDPRSRLDAPVMPREQAAALAHDFAGRLGDHLFLRQHSFDDQYPIDHDRDGRVTLRLESPEE